MASKARKKRPGGHEKTCQNEAGTQEKENPISEELKRKTDQIMGKLRGQATLTSNPADHRGRGGQNGGQIGGKVHMFCEGYKNLTKSLTSLLKVEL